MEFLIAKAEDIPALCLLINNAYRGNSSRKGWTTEADFLDGQRTDPDSLSELMELEKSPELRKAVVLKAEESDKIVGCVYLRKDEDSAYLGMLTVNPELQNSGLGKKILNSAEQFSSEKWACRKMRMRVISNRETLIQWYQRRGFELTGEFEPWPYGNPKFGIPKRSDLKFSILSKTLAAGPLFIG